MPGTRSDLRFEATIPLGCLLTGSVKKPDAEFKHHSVSKCIPRKEWRKDHSSTSKSFLDIAREGG